MLQSSVVYGWTGGLITRLYNVKDFCFHNITHRLKNTVKWMNSVPDHVLYCYYFTIFNVILITQPSLQQTIKRKNTLYVHIFKVGKLYWVNAWIGREIDGLLSKCTSLLGSHFKGCQVTLRSSSVGRYSGGSVSSLSPILISFSSAIVFSCNNKANQNSWSGMQIFYYYFKLFLLFFLNHAGYLDGIFNGTWGGLRNRFDIPQGVWQSIKGIVCSSFQLNVQKPQKKIWFWCSCR